MPLDESTTATADARCPDPLDASATQVIEATPARALPANDATLAPYLLLRFATLPYRLLEDLRPPAATSAIIEQLAAEQAMAAEADVLTDGLFLLVSRIAADDKHYRRKVLQLKREAHGGSATALDAATLQRIGADLATIQQDLALVLARWLAAQTRWQAACAAAQDHLQRELAQVLRPRLRAALDAPLFRRALALASPGLIAHAHRETALPRKPQPDNFERSLLGYLVRASAKTSPFSSFMSTTALRLGGAATPPRLRQLSHDCRARLNRGVMTRIHRAAVLALGDDGPPLRANSTLTALGAQRFRALCDRDLVVLGRPWRQQVGSHFQLHGSLSEVLRATAEALPARVWRERFIAAGVEPQRADGLVAQLLGRGLLQWPDFTDAFDPAPEHSLLACLSDSGAARLEGARQGVAAMVAACDGIAGGGPDADRTGEVERIRSLEAAVHTDLNLAKAEPFQNVVLEDCWSSGVGDGIGIGAVPALGDVARFLATQIGVSPHYLRLRERFVARFGEGGRCDQVLDFLMESGTALVQPREYGDQRADDAAPPAPPGAQLAVTMQVQRLADGGADAPQIVVNKVFEGAGWLAARYGFGATPEHECLRDGLRQWMRTMAGNREPVDMIVNGDCNDLQAHPRLTERVLRWPGEPLRAAAHECVELADLRLIHNPDSGLLDLSDRDGHGIYLCYLGATMASPSWGAPYALSILTQPYQLLRPPHQPSAHDQTSEIQFVPRMKAGRAVLRRALWWLRVDYLRRAWFGHEGAARLADVRRECARSGLPERFFARRPAQADAGMVASSVLHGSRKPLWVDIGNPFCLSLLERLGDGVEWLSFTEALPGPEQLWLDIDGDRHVSEWQLELLLRRA